MSIDISADGNLDTILTEVGGFGVFHVFAYFFLCIPNTISGSTFVNFMFSGANLEHRLVRN